MGETSYKKGKDISLGDTIYYLSPYSTEPTLYTVRSLHEYGHYIIINSQFKVALNSSKGVEVRSQSVGTWEESRSDVTAYVDYRCVKTEVTNRLMKELEKHKDEINGITTKMLDISSRLAKFSKEIV